MKKKFLLGLALPLIGAMTLVSCGEDSSSGRGSGSYIKVNPLTTLGLDPTVLPDAPNILQRSGTINVNLDFEGRHVGWQQVAREYERLHSGAVTVNINWNFSGSTYTETLQDRLSDAINKGSSEWDIVEGNLGYGKTRQACVETHAMIDQFNPYCGSDTTKVWRDYLSSRAWKNYDSDTKEGDHYILNSEDMQSCWFVNKVALKAAYNKGYRNSDNVDDGTEYPITWDDLINLCSKMEEAGYSNPLGISLSEASIKSLQFTWLLRIYGDYYYRQFYKYIMGGSSSSTWESWDDDTSPADGLIETKTGFGTKNCKVANLLFDEDTTFGPGYAGFNSEHYIDFVKQLRKMKGHLILNAPSTEFSSVRSQFKNQANKQSAQIILDYLGQGLQYKNYEEQDKFELGWFDYPQMKSGTYEQAGRKHRAGDKIVSDNTITRDIGGNGGFISVVNHRNDPQKTELSKDFVRFFMSPYGQTIYYKALAESADHITPKGLTTIDNDLVVIPEAWKNFFNETTSTSPTAPANSQIKFNGNVDPNTFLSYGVRYFNGYVESEASIVSLWTGLLTTDNLTEETFAAQWGQKCKNDMLTMAADSEHGWPTDFYLNPDLGY